MRDLFKKSTTILATLIVGIRIYTSSIYAAVNTPMFGGKYTQGVGNITIYIDNASNAGYWEKYIKGGANNWMYPGYGMSNPIYIQFVSSNYGSKMDFYCASNSFFANTAPSWVTVAACTEFYDSNENKVFPKINNSVSWYYAKIYINNDVFKKDSFSDNEAQGTIIHEMGHAFGLDHNNDNKYSIMCQSAQGRQVERVTTYDNNSINVKYN